MGAFDTKKDAMNTFISELAEKRRAAEATKNIKSSMEYRWGTIKEKQKEGTKNAAREVFLTIYRDALPLDDTHKQTFQSSLNDRMLSFVEKETGSDDVYDWLKTAAVKKGCIPAKKICDAVEHCMTEACTQYYEEEDMDVDAIDMSKTSKTVSDTVKKVTSDMDADEVSSIIESNVKATIAKEIAISKEEDEKLAALEEELSSDETVISESAIDVALLDAGFTPNQVYHPSLFNGIMMGEVSRLESEGLSGQDVQKKAFYESVQELTVLQTLQTLGLIDINVHNIDKMALNYANQQ